MSGHAESLQMVCRNFAETLEIFGNVDGEIIEIVKRKIKYISFSSYAKHEAAPHINTDVWGFFKGVNYKGFEGVCQL